MLYNHIWLQLTMIYLCKLCDSASCEGLSESAYFTEIASAGCCDFFFADFSQNFPHSVFWVSQSVYSLSEVNIFSENINTLGLGNPYVEACFIFFLWRNVEYWV